MNVIQTADFLSITATKLENISANDISVLIAKLQEAKNHNPQITEDTISQFSEALLHHSKALEDVMHQRVLVNFFTEKDYPRSMFSHSLSFQSNRNTRLFVELFLGTELLRLIQQRMTENNFSDLRALAEIQGFFPESVSAKIVQELQTKLELATTALTPKQSDFSKITYIKEEDFFGLVSQFKSPFLEEKMKALFTAVKNWYYLNNNSELAKVTFAAMKKYVAIDPTFSEQISQFKRESEMQYQPFTINRSKYKWVYFLVGLVVCLELNFLWNRLSAINFNTESETFDYTAEPPKLDRYYTGMKFKIDSFQVFLTDYNPKEIRRLSPITTIKTGQNPFETFYEHPPTGESSNNLRVANESLYDMVLLENAILYDSIEIPRTAHFIKAGDFHYIHFNREDTRTVFNAYVGKKLATFQTESNHLFVRSGSVVEYRFSELAPNANAILKQDFEFKNDVKLYYRNGELIQQ
ncbi:hypothetical protein [Flavobacterium sp.]|jgi:hypothetical protein|uniref:hypothetical protein n=1 Tax=Flavobacterium sp. TaxID=239 RepID=UPI0037BFBF2B